MDWFYILIIYVSTLLTRHRTSALGVNPCYKSKDAPERTLGLFFGQWDNDDCQPYGDQDNIQNPVQSPGEDYVDPVYSGEDNDYQDNHRPTNRPTETNSINGVFSWLPAGFITQDHWPTRPPRPQKPHRPPRPPFRPPIRPPHRPPRPPRPPIYNPPRPPGFPGFLFPGWLTGWFNPEPQKPMKPWGNKPGADNIKPVYEHVEEDEEPVSWRPGPVVGGPNHDIIAVTQDLTHWSTEPPPRPTRPQIPGYNRGNTINNQGIVGSFTDLLFKK